MKRLSRDSTAPRRPTGTRRAPQPRPEELTLVEESAGLVRSAWTAPYRPSF